VLPFWQANRYRQYCPLKSLVSPVGVDLEKSLQLQLVLELLELVVMPQLHLVSQKLRGLARL
jgi:hypothetical protein